MAALEGYVATEEEEGCIECVMAWLLYGDGAVCLAGHGEVYWGAK